MTEHHEYTVEEVFGSKTKGIKGVFPPQDRHLFTEMATKYLKNKGEAVKTAMQEYTALLNRPVVQDQGERMWRTAQLGLKAKWDKDLSGHSCGYTVVAVSNGGARPSQDKKTFWSSLYALARSADPTSPFEGTVQLRMDNFLEEKDVPVLEVGRPYQVMGSLRTDTGGRTPILSVERTSEFGDAKLAEGDAFAANPSRFFISRMGAPMPLSEVLAINTTNRTFVVDGSVMRSRIGSWKGAGGQAMTYGWVELTDDSLDPEYITKLKGGVRFTCDPRLAAVMGEGSLLRGFGRVSIYTDKATKESRRKYYLEVTDVIIGLPGATPDEVPAPEETAVETTDDDDGTITTFET